MMWACKQKLEMRNIFVRRFSFICQTFVKTYVVRLSNITIVMEIVKSVVVIMNKCFVGVYVEKYVWIRCQVSDSL